MLSTNNTAIELTGDIQAGINTKTKLTVEPSPG